MSTIPIASTSRQLQKRLRERFGFRQFRQGQAEAVLAALEGRDTLVVMPTGSGKSLCFQLPALELEGTTIVVSPLIALMKDQADNLRERGISVAVVNSSLSAAERRAAEQAIADGEVEFVYTTPERMANPEFRDLLRTQPIDLFVVDEAHCVSQWGHDFRPEYLSLGQAIDDLGRPPILALTATATPDVIDDVRRHLRMLDAEVVHTGFYRNNLHLSVIPTVGDLEKRAALVPLIQQAGGSGIVYAATVKAVEELTHFLSEQGIAAEGYHGRMSAKRREAAQDAFMEGRTPVMVATNAFGMGIDKSDIRFVIHYHLPGTMEAFYQELGRAGRDGDPARTTLLHDPEDRKLQRFFQGGRYPDESDLVNAHHTLKRLIDLPEPPTFDELQAISPLSKTRMKICLSLLDAAGFVRSERGGRYRLLRPDATSDELARAGSSYRERRERDLLKQQQMSEYAETRTCRWTQMVGYFESDEVSAPCGHCDRCENAILPVPA